MKNIFKYLKGDQVIWVIAILFMGISALSIYSFIPILIKINGGTPFGYLIKHILYIVLGLGVMFWLHRKNPINVEKLSKFIFYVAVILLVFTFFFGVSVNNATRWIQVPVLGLTFQTSEFAKFALVIFIARRLVTKKDEFHSWKKGFFPIILPVILICALILKENFSTAALLFTVILGMFFIAKVPFGKIFSAIGGMVALGAIAFLINLSLPQFNLLPRMDTWVNRIFRAYGEEGSFDNMQAVNARLAIHNGGYFGVGVGNGDLKKFTPDAYADFFYSSFVEEFGLTFAIILILLYLILFYRILKIGLHADRLFETYLCLGIGLLFLSQVMVNMFVCTGLMPVTGQNMPFLGMGGSSMIMSCIGLGIVLSISNKNNKIAQKKNL